MGIEVREREGRDRDGAPTNRCLVVIDGFYEWRNGDRQPFYFHRKDRKPFAVGAFTRTSEPTCAIVTCPAGEAIDYFSFPHAAVLEHADWTVARSRTSRGDARGLRALPRFSFVVDKAANDVPECVEPIEDPGRRSFSHV